MSDSPDDLMPALNADEWMEFGESKPFFDRLASGGRPFGPNRRFTDDQKLLTLAALALYRLPRRFNHVELDAILAAARIFDLRRGPGDVAAAATLRALHEKISALIPPKGVVPLHQE